MSIASDIAPHLPFLRRYARALAGSQQAGDQMVKKALEEIAADVAIIADQIDAGVEPRLALYRCFQLAWPDTPAPEIAAAAQAATSREATASQRLAAITPLPRQALLLGAMEGFTVPDTAYLLDCTTDKVDALVAEAVADIERQTRTNVLIIEDEPIIAMHLENIVTELGHGVTATATTVTEAMAAYHAAPPGLVLVDVQLADGSSGIDAVRHILADRILPVIFITAFPERLLTGERPEPTFLVTKPFQTATVEAAIAQALFFNSTAANGT